MNYEIVGSSSKGNCIEEIWKPIEDFKNKYEISNLGRIRNKKNKILKPSDNGHGYLKINLRKNNKTYNNYVHRLVALAFIPNLNNLPEINHINENTYDNNVNNLEWCSSKYNANYGNRNKKCQYKKQLLYGKKVKQYDLEGKYITTMYMFEAIKLKKVYYASLIRCCKGIYKTCGGYIWKYSNE